MNEITPIEVKELQKSFCKVKFEDNEGTGLFMKLDYRNKGIINFLITCSHILSNRIGYLQTKKMTIDIEYIEKKIEINLGEKNRIIDCFDKPMDIIIIEILSSDFDNKNNNIKFLEYDLTITYEELKGKNIYIFHHPLGEEAKWSKGKIKQLINDDFNYDAYTNKGSSGAPIFLIDNLKLIGIHKKKEKEKEKKKNHNIRNCGIFIGKLIEELNKEKEIYNYFINITKLEGIKVKKNEFIKDQINNKEKNILINKINKETYLNQCNYITIRYKNCTNKTINIFGKCFVEINKENCKIVIDDKEFKLNSIIKKSLMKKVGNEYEINLKIFKRITNLSFMFHKCNLLSSIENISELNKYGIKDIHNMFSDCESIESFPDISKFDTSKVINMNNLFSRCKSLAILPDISKWNTSNVKYMKNIFLECKSLTMLTDISKWNTSNVIDMSGIFSGCNSLKTLSDISQWNTSNVTNISNLFYECESLESIPDISKWNTSNVIYMGNIFLKCKSLIILPDISKWNISNVIDMKYMFSFCYSLLSIPDISNWNTSKVTNMSGIFSNCISLTNLPDISLWNTDKMKNMNKLFYKCLNLSFLPDISKWNISKVKNMDYMFSDCEKLLYLPDISKWNNNQLRFKQNMFLNLKSLKNFPNLSKLNLKKADKEVNLFGETEIINNINYLK